MNVLGENKIFNARQTFSVCDALSRFSFLVDSGSEPKHLVRYHTHTEGPPVYCRPRRLSPEMLNVVKAEFDKLLKQGIVSRSNSNWASPLHLVKKADGSYRPCGVTEN